MFLCFSIEIIQAGRDFLKQSWGEEKLNRVNGFLDARDNTSSSSSDEEAPIATTTTVATSSKSKSKAKPKLSKARTMKTTAKVCSKEEEGFESIALVVQEAKVLIGKEVLGDTRADTKRRQAAINAKKVLEEVTKPSGGRKPGLKRLGTMGQTARVSLIISIDQSWMSPFSFQEGQAYIKRTGGTKTTTGRKRTGGRAKKSSK